MRQYLALRHVAYDHVTVGPLQTVRLFVDPSTDNRSSPRLVDLHEDALGAALLADRQSRDLLLTELGLGGDVEHALKVRAPFVYARDRKPGDIDMMFVPRHAPHCTTVVETKRAKVRQDSAGSGQRINHLTLARAEIDQVNALAKLGFSRTILALLIAVEDCGRVDIPVMLRGMTTGTVEMFVDTSLQAPLDPSIGVCIVEAVQPTTRAFSECGCIGAAMLRWPEVREQSNDLTQLVARFFRDRRCDTSAR